MIRRFKSSGMGLAFVLSVVILFGGSRYAYASNEGSQVNLEALAWIESSGREDVCSFRGCAYGRGLHQVSEATLGDYNRAHGTQYAPGALFNPTISAEVAGWHMDWLLKRRAVRGTQDALIAYNWGIGNFWRWVEEGRRMQELPRETYNYILKYQAALARHK